MKSFNQTIDGVEYIRTVYSDRIETLVPVAGWPEIPQGRTPKLRKALLIAGIEKVCKCGSKENLDAHHKIPVKYLKNKNGNTYQDPAGNHSASNGEWLCRSCHNKLHNSNI